MPPSKWEVVKEEDAPKQPWQVVGEEDAPTYLGEAGMGVVRGMKDMLPSAPSTADLILGPVAGVVKSGIDTAKGIYQGIKEDEGGWAGKVLRTGESLPLIGPVIKKAEEAGPGNFKMEPQTVGAIAEGITQAVVPFAAERGVGALKSVGSGRTAAAAIDAAHENFSQGIQKALPPTLNTPYEPEDVAAVAPHVFDMHNAAPITGAKDLAAAFDSVNARIEDNIAGHVKDIGPVVASQGILHDVEAALSGSNKTGFAQAGINALKKYNLDGPLTLDRVDSLRREMGLDNAAIEQQVSSATDPGSKVASLRSSNPEYAAREAALELLRDREYATFKENGVPDVDQLRRVEGASMRLKRASNASRFEGDTEVSGTGGGGVLRTAAKGSSIALGTVGGYKLGGVAGGAAGGVLGGAIGDKLFSKGPLTVDELIRNSMPDIKMPGAEFPARQFKPTRQLAAPGGTVLSEQTPEITSRRIPTSQAPPSGTSMGRILGPPREPGTAYETVSQRQPGSLEMFSPEEAWKLRTDLKPELGFPEVKSTEPPIILHPKAWVLPKLKGLMKGRGNIIYP